MWIWVTVLGLLVEMGVIVLLGRSATRGSEQDTGSPAVPRAAVSRADRHGAPAARR
jgi:hypothetical protein